jgi:hypothetical protein
MGDAKLFPVMSAMIQSGLDLLGGDNKVIKETTFKMLDLMIVQYEEK